MCHILGGERDRKFPLSCMENHKPSTARDSHVTLTRSGHSQFSLSELGAHTVQWTRIIHTQDLQRLVKG